MLLCEARKGTEKNQWKKQGKKKVVGALIAHVDWVSLALEKWEL